jgi:hypothetical protein
LKTTKVNFDTAPGTGRVRYALSEECKWTCGAVSQQVRFAVVDDVPNLPSSADGILGWPAISNLVFQFDIERRTCGFSDELPADLKGWAKWKLTRSSPILAFECSDGKEVVRVGIDTASQHGVWLSPDRWRRWRASRKEGMATFDGVVLMTGEVEVVEVVRVRTITLGGITLNEMPVGKIPQSMMVFQRCDAVFGLWAIRQLRLVIDGKGGYLYTKAAANVLPQYPSYPFNLAGAVFAPHDMEKGVDLIAHVITNGPAWRAGIRDGDVLLKIGVRKVTNWRTDPTILPLSRFWSQPAGTKHRLTLKRGDQTYETVVTLEDLPAVD